MEKVQTVFTMLSKAYINTFNGNTSSYKQEKSSEKWLREDGRGLETDARVRRSLIHLPALISYSPSAPRPFPQSSDLPNVKHNKQLAAHQASIHHHSLQINYPSSSISHRIAATNTASLHLLELEQ